MSEIDISKWQPLYQVFALVGAAIAGGLMWFLGIWKRSGSGEATSDRLQARLDTQELRRDLETVIGAARQAMINKVEEQSRETIRPLEERLRQLELRLTRIEARMEMSDHDGH